MPAARAVERLRRSAAADEDDARAHLVGLHAIAVEFHLVHPAVAGRHALGRHGLMSWMNEEARGLGCDCE